MSQERAARAESRMRTVESVDASNDRTRLYFKKDREDEYWTDVLTFRGHVKVTPGEICRVTIDFGDGAEIPTAGEGNDA